MITRTYYIDNNFQEEDDGVPMPFSFGDDPGSNNSGFYELKVGALVLVVCAGLSGSYTLLVLDRYPLTPCMFSCSKVAALVAQVACGCVRLFHRSS